MAFSAVSPASGAALSASASVVQEPIRSSRLKNSVMLHWLSASITSTLFSWTLARIAAVLMVVSVLPTPPFKFTKLITRMIHYFPFCLIRLCARIRLICLRSASVIAVAL